MKRIAVSVTLAVFIGLVVAGQVFAVADYYFEDHFEDGSISGSLWESWTMDNNVVSETGGHLRVYLGCTADYPGGATDCNAGVGTLGPYNESIEVVFRAKVPDFECADGRTYEMCGEGGPPPRDEITNWETNFSGHGTAMLMMYDWSGDPFEYDDWYLLWGASNDLVSTEGIIIPSLASDWGLVDGNWNDDLVEPDGEWHRYRVIVDRVSDTVYMYMDDVCYYAGAFDLGDMSLGVALAGAGATNNADPVPGTYSDYVYFDDFGIGPAYSQPSDFYALPLSSTSIGLHWTTGSNSTQTGVFYKLGGYPASRDEGTQIYLGSAESYTHYGLIPGTTYYYRAWGYSPTTGTWSANYDQDYATTLAGGGREYPDVPEPPEWDQEPRCDLYDNIGILPLITGACDSYELPYPTGCLLLTVGIIMILGAVAYVVGKVTHMLIVVMGAIAIFAILGPLPLWFLFAEIVLGVLLAYLWPRV